MANGCIALVCVTMVACYVLPGYVLSLVAESGRRQDAGRTPWGDFLMSTILASTLWTGWWGMVLLQAGRFSLSAVVLGNCGVSVGLAVVNLIQRGLWCPRLRHLSVGNLVALALVLMAAFLFFHPHEFVLGGADAGVYVNLGSSILKTGSWLIQSDLVAELPEVLLPAFLREQPAAAASQYIQFPGFYVTDPGTGEITPQFYPLHPLWLALLNGVGGVRLSLYATPIWGVLGVCAVAMVADALFGKRCGLLSMALLSMTATQIWFSRYPASEMLTQYLLFGGMWALIRYFQGGAVWYAWLAGAALGESMLARLDLYFLIVIPAVYGVQRLKDRQLSWRDLAFLVPFCVIGGQSLVFACTRSWPYFSAVYGPTIDRILQMPLLIVCGVCAFCVTVGLLIKYFGAGGSGQSPDVQNRLARAWSLGTRILAVVVTLAALYAYFVRPALADTDAGWYYWYGDNEVPNVEPYNLVRLGWYLTPLGLVLALAGIWLALWRPVSPSLGLLMGIGLFFSTLFIASSRNNPHHIYVMRRYVPMVIPFLMVMMAYGLDRLGRLGKWQRVASTGLTGALAAWLISAAWLQMIHIEYDGVLSQLETQVEALGAPSTIILFNDDMPVSTGALLGTPLEYLYGYSVFDLQEQYVDASMLAELVASWRADGRRVLVADGPSAVSWPTSRLLRAPLTNFHLTYPILEVSYDHKPGVIWEQTLDVDFYEVVGTK